jgi:excisionase family DNA binding protein
MIRTVVPELSLNLSADVPHELIVAIAQEVAKILAAGGAGAEPVESGWMSAAQAAEYLGWPAQRIYKLTAAGAIPHRKHGQRLLFDRAELDEWLDGYAHGTRRRGFQLVSKAS